jgi:hypothetical protein
MHLQFKLFPVETLNVRTFLWALSALKGQQCTCYTQAGIIVVFYNEVVPVNTALLSAYKCHCNFTCITAVSVALPQTNATPSGMYGNQRTQSPVGMRLQLPSVLKLSETSRRVPLNCLSKQGEYSSTNVYFSLVSGEGGHTKEHWEGL